MGSDPSAGIAVSSSDQSFNLTLDNAKLTILVSQRGLDVGGKIIITGTDGDISVRGGQYGMYAKYGIKIEGGTVEAIGATAAFNTAPDLTQYNGDYTVWVKDNAGEAEAKEWNSATGNSLNSYQYVKIVPVIKTYPLWIGSAQVTDANLNDILGDGTGSAKFEPSTNTLTLNAPAITGEHEKAGIYSSLAEPLTIQGVVTVSGEEYGIYAENGITISGEDTVVTADGKKAAIIAAKGKIDFTAPLMILEPNAWFMKYNTAGALLIYDGENSENLATHVLIRQGEYYDIYVGGVHVNSLNKDNILNEVDANGDPTAKFDPDTNSLTLNNPTIKAVNKR